MKRILTTGLLTLCAGVLTYAATMHEPHQLTSLWKQYTQAQMDDLPQKEAEILSQIKQEAQAQHLAVDFYDAATEYVNTVQRRDWKQRDALREQLRKEVEAFANPMVTFLWMEEWKGAGCNELWPYLQAHLTELQGCNPAFYDGLGVYLGGALKSFVASDREYLLWRLFKSRYQWTPEDEMYQALRKEIEGRYPAQAALELYELDKHYWSKDQREAQRAAYQALSDQYAGKAVSLFPRAQLLQMRLADLEKDKAPESAFKELYAQAKAFEKERKAYKGDEAVIAKGCTRGQSLVESLEAKDLEVYMDADGIRVVFQNLQKASLTLRQEKKTLQSWEVENPQPHFYLQDTVKLALPRLADGYYSIEAVSGSISDQASYTQFTLSIATRRDSRGRCVYVTDYRTGQPLQKTMLRLLKGGKVLAISELKLDGFTPLPEAMDRELDRASNESYHLEAVSGDRCSLPVYVESQQFASSDRDYPQAYIYKDQGAYRPGETVHFKAVVFEGNPATGLHVSSGKAVEMQLYDTEGKLLESKPLTTNEYGSVWGGFVLPTGLRNGFFRLELKGLASDSFRVDEYVLPSFDLRWDALKELYFVGQQIPLSGELLSYSGHNLSGARLHLELSCYGLIVHQADTVADGRRFCFEAPLPREGWYQTTLTVTDPTGETQAFKQGFYVGGSLSVEARVENAADAQWELTDSPQSKYRRYREPRAVVRSRDLKVTLLGKDGGGRTVPIPVRYSLLDASGKLVLRGEAPSGQTVALQLPGSGLYLLETAVSAQLPNGKMAEDSDKMQILCTLPGDKKLPGNVRYLFMGGESTLADGQGISALLGSGKDDVWAVVTLYGKAREVLECRQIRLSPHTLTSLSFAYKAAYPDAVRLQVFYFLNGGSQRFTQEYRRARDRYTLPLQFTRFTADARPGTEYQVTLKTAPGVEALAAVWDKSLDAISANDWPLVQLRDVSVEDVYVSAQCGKVASGGERNVFYSLESKMMVRSSNAMAVQESAEMMDDAAPLAAGAGEEVKLRSDFSTALAFEPALTPSADGTLSFRFRTSDKLSTYYIRVYAHDPEMHNAAVEEEMVVSLPVQVQLLPPRFLYAGDVWEAAVNVSSVADVPVSGTLRLEYGISAQQVPITVPAGQGASYRFLVALPSSPAPAGDLLVTASFLAEDFSDAVQVTLPVLPAAQQLTEAHSAVLRAGMDREALLADLRARFVNVPASAAMLQERSLLDLVREALPSHAEPSSPNALALSEAWYVQSLMDNGSAAQDLLASLLECQNQDGGFAWFPGMDSSPIITAVLLERFAKLRDRGFEVPEMTSAVAYLDKEQFGTVRPVWRGAVSDAQYVHVRALYAGIPFTVTPVSEADQKRMAAFGRWAKEYLAPSTGTSRGLVGQILPKARRVLTLRNLLTRDGGQALAKAWGVKLSTRCRMKNSLRKDMASLLQYAVEHRDGGWYYPNAVMPWRGLLESEAYAHSLLCDLLSAAEGTDIPSAVEGSPEAIADGIRLWLMLQKETQKWEADPAFVDAILSVLDGSEEVLNTRVLVLSASFEAPFREVQASGNGFSIERQFFRDGKALKPGASVAVGDRIEAKYKIWNAENRSFVQVVAGREAALTPVRQLSGMVWGGYRNVKANRTEFYFDTYPEEETVLTEEFFVTQAGTFQAPVLTVESLYAPHYRANDGWSGVLSAEAR